MKRKEFVADYLRFTRKERIGILAVVITNTKAAKQDTAWTKAMARLEQKETETSNSFQRKYDDDNSTAYQYDRSTNNYTHSNKGELFNFDPNTLSTEGWQKLGIRDKTIHTIQNYLGKGGHFKKPEDLQRVYGLFPNEYERIAPYIKIESSREPIADKDFPVKNTTQAAPPKVYTSRYTVIDINTTDTSMLIALPGIGSKLAMRIINFRNKLGGFYSLSQVGETFGLPDSTFQKIKQYLKLESTSLRKININTVTVDELKAHPYIRYALANPIVAYRNEHGPFAKIDDIKKVMAVTDEIYNKIAPYLFLQ
jgi:competence protein ComEA